MKPRNVVCVLLAILLSFGLVPLVPLAFADEVPDSNQTQDVQDQDNNGSEVQASLDEGEDSDENGEEASGVFPLDEEMETLAVSLPDSFLATIEASYVANMVLDVPKASLDIRVGLQLYRNNMTPAQRFLFTKQSDGYYVITNVNSNLVLDVAGGQVINGTVIQQYRPNGTDAQRWLLESSSGGTVTLRSKLNNDYVIDIKSAGTVGGTKIQLYQSNNTPAQHFKLNLITRTVSDGYYVISSPVGPTVMDIASASLERGANVRMWKPNDTFAQKFLLAYDSENGYYTITSACSGLALDVAGGKVAAGTNVQQWRPNGTNAQKWTIVETSPGSRVYVVYVAGGCALEVAGGSSAVGANIQINAPSGTAAQQFIFTPSELVVEGVYTIESVSASPKVVDVVSGSMAAGASLQVYRPNNTIAQKFRFNRVAANTFTIESIMTGYLMSEVNGALVMAANTGVASQQWSMRASGPGGITFVNCSSGKVLDVSKQTGPALQVYRDNGTVAQVFTLTMVAELIPVGQYSLMPFANLSQVLDIASASIENGAPLQCWRPNGTNAQKFWLLRTNDGYFQIIASNSYKALEVENDALGMTGRVIQNTIDAIKLSQKWTFEYAGSGCFQIVSALGGGTHALTLQSAGAENGTNLATAVKSAAGTQMFRFALIQYGSAMGSSIVANGIDVSSWQPALIGYDVDYDFMIVKATGGNSYRNPNLSLQADAALARGRKLGLYHYAQEPGGWNSAIVEADWFVSNIGPYLGRAVLFLDYEEECPGPDRDWVRDFCKRVKERTGVSCQIYTSGSWAKNYINGLWTDLDVWLWEASWPAGSPVFNGYKPTNAYWFSPNQGMKVHQYTSNGRLTGYTKPLDFNAYYGSREEWTFRETH